jgi:hypothetical protein
MFAACLMRTILGLLVAYAATVGSVLYLVDGATAALRLSAGQRQCALISLDPGQKLCSVRR